MVVDSSGASVSDSGGYRDYGVLRSSSVKFSIFRPIEGRPLLSELSGSRQQELQPSKQKMEVITGGGQHGVNGIAGMVCKIIAAHAVARWCC
jgi:hypothetical protein